MKIPWGLNAFDLIVAITVLSVLVYIFIIR